MQNLPAYLIALTCVLLLSWYFIHCCLKGKTEKAILKIEMEREFWLIFNNIEAAKTIEDLDYRKHFFDLWAAKNEIRGKEKRQQIKDLLDLKIKMLTNGNPTHEYSL